MAAELHKKMEEFEKMIPVKLGWFLHDLGFSKKQIKQIIKDCKTLERQVYLGNTLFEKTLNREKITAQTIQAIIQNYKEPPPIID